MKIVMCRRVRCRRFVVTCIRLQGGGVTVSELTRV